MLNLELRLTLPLLYSTTIDSSNIILGLRIKVFNSSINLRWFKLKFEI